MGRVWRLPYLDSDQKNYTYASMIDWLSLDSIILTADRKRDVAGLMGRRSQRPSVLGQIRSSARTIGQNQSSAHARARPRTTPVTQKKVTKKKTAHDSTRP